MLEARAIGIAIGVAIGTGLLVAQGRSTGTAIAIGCVVGIAMLLIAYWRAKRRPKPRP